VANGRWLVVFGFSFLHNKFKFGGEQIALQVASAAKRGPDTER